MKNLGIYIHIPFCKSKCYYCDFISFSCKEDKIEQYINALKKEIELYKQELKEDIIIDTIYIGGGTPSFIDSKYIVSIINKFKDSFNILEEAEITIEVNPGTITKEKLINYKNTGINRLSIGLQTTDDNLLKKIGRIHTYDEFIATYNLAREIGFNNINIDLMLALPGQTLNKLIEDINKIISLKPEHISVYSLMLEEDTKLYSMVQNNELNLPDEDLERTMYWKAKRKLEESGYEHYEISNFAKKSQESKYNLNCWNQNEYIGFGVNAHSYENNIRFCNTNNLEEYILSILQAKDLNFRIIEEEQNKLEQEKEFMMLGFRKIEGIHISNFKNKFVDNPLYLFRKELASLAEKGLIQIDGDNIKLTNKGIDFANIVFEEFV